MTGRVTDPSGNGGLTVMLLERAGSFASSFEPTVRDLAAGAPHEFVFRISKAPALGVRAKDPAAEFLFIFEDPPQSGEQLADPTQLGPECTATTTLAGDNLGIEAPAFTYKR